MNSRPIFETYARGKLLLTGEYFVLDGAMAVALPVNYGQHFRVEAATENLHWRSLEADGQLWFEAIFSLPDLEILQTSDAGIAQTLVSILRACCSHNPAFLTEQTGFSITTYTDFPRSWGLGTSSTLIAAVGRWAKANPYAVLFDTLGGSGYDLACAYADGPILYQLTDAKPRVQAADFQPVFADHLYFVFLGKKQDSRAGITRYRTQARGNGVLLEKISALTRRCLLATHLLEFEAILAEHEQIISQALDLSRAKDLFFSDYWGEVKSLGAWGGDFILVTSQRPMEETRAFFNERGYTVFIPYQNMVAFPTPVSS